MSIATRTPMREVEVLRDRFDKLFSELMTWPRPASEPVTLPLDVKETDSEIVVTASMPGFKPEDIDVEISRGVLTIRGETKSEREEKEGVWHVQERRWGSVQRAFTLPVAVDEEHAKATLENGVLTITLPKTERPQKRHIEVKSA